MHLQLAEGNNVYLADQCGLPPIKPLRSRSKAPEKWAEYDRKKAEWDACREGKGKSTTFDPVKAAILSPGRALFLLLLDMNVDGIASRLATSDVNTMKSMWNKMGGDSRKLIQMINDGKGKSPKRLGFLTKFVGPTALAEGDEENPSDLTNEQKAKIIAATTALGGVVAGAFPGTAPVAIPGGPILGTVIIRALPIIKQAANKTEQDEKNGAALPPLPLPSKDLVRPTNTVGTLSWADKKNFTGLTNKTTVLIAGNLVGFGGAGILFMKNKKKAAIVLAGMTLAADAAYYFASKNNA